MPPWLRGTSRGQFKSQKHAQLCPGQALYSGSNELSPGFFFLPFFSNRFLFCKELGIPLVDFNIPSLSYPFDVLTTFPRERVIFLVLCFWICICSPRFGEISALMSLSKFLIRIEYLTFYSCTLKIYGFYLKIHPIHPLLISKQPRLLLSCTLSYFLPVIVSQLISLLLFLKLILHTIDREILLKTTFLPMTVSALRIRS